MKKGYAAFVVLAIVCAAYGKPDQPAPKGKAKEVPVPALAGECVWGFISQDARAVFIQGSSAWEAEGVIRKDGTLYLLWTCSSGRQVNGVYKINTDGSIVGRWGWVDQTTIERDGKLTGSTSHETIRRAPDAPIF